jgi:hypothetical protein
MCVHDRQGLTPSGHSESIKARFGPARSAISVDLSILVKPCKAVTNGKLPRLGAAHNRGRHPGGTGVSSLRVVNHGL